MDLKDLLGEELYAQVSAKAEEAKAKIDIVSTGEWIPKAKFDEVNSAKNRLEETIKDRDKQLEDLKTEHAGAEDLKSTISGLQAENKAKQADYEKALKDERLTSALRYELKGKAHDPDIVIKMLDREKLLPADDGSVTGLEDQLKTLEAEKSFLFIPKKDAEEASRFESFTPKESQGSSKGSTMAELIGNTLDNI